MAEDSSHEPGAGERISPEADVNHTVRVQQLFVKHLSRVKAFILSLQPDFTEADDTVQEVFLVVTRKAGDFAEGSNFMAWVLTIARYKVLEALRRRKAAECALSEEVIEILCASAPEETFFEGRFAAVRTCLEKLTPRMQEVVRLRYFGEHGPGEIARLLSWTPNSVNVTLSRARKLLHDCVGRQLQGA
jgi:RNA polymerase sigma-70 factor, ECF subfamily